MWYIKKLAAQAALTAALALWLGASPLSSLAAQAAERAATSQELARVRAEGRKLMQWEKTEETWRLLYLAEGESQWRYATGWVRIAREDGSVNYYYMNQNGDMSETWILDNNVWYFAIRDNYWRDKPEAGKVITGWAKIPDQYNQYHIFYFGAAQNGRPTGMYQDQTAVIDGVKYRFDENGYCYNPPKGYIPRYSLKRTVQ